MPVAGADVMNRDEKRALSGFSPFLLIGISEQGQEISLHYQPN